MELRIQAGATPAGSSSLSVYAGDELVTNAIVGKAYWVGDKVLVADIEIRENRSEKSKNENNKPQERVVHPPVQSKQRPAK